MAYGFRNDTHFFLKIRAAFPYIGRRTKDNFHGRILDIGQQPRAIIRTQCRSALTEIRAGVLQAVFLSGEMAHPK